MDRKRWQKWIDLYFEKQPKNTQLLMEIPDIVTIDTTVGELHDVLMNAFWIPPRSPTQDERKLLSDEIIDLRKQLALAEVKLEVQVQGELLETTPPKWEYHWDSDFGDFNVIGVDGWEAVLIFKEMVLFKRQL